MKQNNINEFENKLIKFKAKRININQDYEYYVHIGHNRKRCHLSKEEKSIVRLSNKTINSRDEYLSYVIDVNNRPSDLVKMGINCFYKILILIKVNGDTILDYCAFFPMIDDSFSERIRSELFNE